MNTILTSQPNFRDLGGLRTSDGSAIRPGMLFRSGDLFALVPEDLEKLEGMGLATIIDFRAAREVVKRPDKAVASVKEVIHLAIHDAARDRAEKLLAENDAAGLETVLIHDYRRMIHHHRHDFSRFLHILATTENLPLVYHCAAGKDRTGLATVFLLTALGVDLETIRSDYLVTNHYAKPYADRIIRKMIESGMNGEIVRPLFEVRKEYLDAALEEIDHTSGSLEHFVLDVLHADTRRLREKYLVR